MKYSDFVWICGMHTIDPNIALENDMVRKILKMKLHSLNMQLLLNSYLKTSPRDFQTQYFKKLFYVRYLKT